MVKRFYVYILTNQFNKVLYIGVTSNLPQRVYQHRNKLIEGFTSRYNLTKLVYYEQIEEAMTAFEREKSLKNLVRRKKVQLINEFNFEWRDLYEAILK